MFQNASSAPLMRFGSPMVKVSTRMFALASVSRSYIHGWNLDFTTQPGRTLLRLSTAMANRGRGVPAEARSREACRPAVPIG